jgi:DNA-binding NarL/FixJ family response regulator
MLPKTAASRIVVLKGDRLYGDLICRQIRELWRNANVQTFQRGFDALDAMQASMPDLFITGVKIEDMDGLEHLEPFIERELPILIVTSRKDERTFSLLRTIRYDGIYDGFVEGLGNLRTALEQVMSGELYVSPTFAQHLKKPKNITLDALTDREQMVLSVIGDGSDDQQAADLLRLTPRTVNTHRKTIMRKLALNHKGQLMLYALQQGYVRVTPNGIYHPGFQRRIRGVAPEPKIGETNECTQL